MKEVLLLSLNTSTIPLRIQPKVHHWPPQALPDLLVHPALLLNNTLMQQIITELLSISLTHHMLLIFSFQVFEDATLPAQTIPHSLHPHSDQHLLAPPFPSGLR